MHSAASEVASLKPQRHREIVGLDLLRFAAAAMVMAFHLGYWQWAAPQTRTARLVGLDLPFPTFGRIASNGWVGVEIFFVISGFVIAWSARQASLASFVRSRFLRLAPAAWICSTFSALAFLAMHSADARSLLVPYARTLSFFPTAPWIDDAYWTLDVEIAFYAVVALMIAVDRRSWIIVAIGAIGAMSATFWFAFAFRDSVGGLTPWLLAASRSRYADLALLHHGCFFCIGVLFCRAMETKRLGRTEIWLGAICLLAGFIEIACSAAIKSEVTGFPQSVAAPIVIWVLALAAMAASIRFNARLASFDWLKRSRTIGLATYPLYLLHTVIGGLTIKALAGYGVPAPLAVAVGAAAALSLAVLVSERLEPALRAPVRRLLSAREAAPRAPAPQKLGRDFA